LPKSIPFVQGRFGTVGEKLRELFRCQGVSDKPVKAFYEHKKAHATALSGRRRAALVSGGFTGRHFYEKRTFQALALET